MQYPLLLLFLLVAHANGFNIEQFRTHARTSTLRVAGAPKGTDKIRVKLLDNVNAVGKKGDIVLVSQTQWLNVLQPKKVAMQISDAQLAKMLHATQTTALKHDLESKELFSSVSTLPVLRMTHKAGPNMQLFGAMTAKTLLDLIKRNLPPHVEKSFAQKSITIKSITEQVTETRKSLAAAVEVAGSAKMEIRKVGLFDIKLQLPEDRTAVVRIEVAPE